jgi:hypothetical protein
LFSKGDIVRLVSTPGPDRDYKLGSLGKVTRVYPPRSVYTKVDIWVNLELNTETIITVMVDLEDGYVQEDNFKIEDLELVFSG